MMMKKILALVCASSAFFLSGCVSTLPSNPDPSGVPNQSAENFNKVTTNFSKKNNWDTTLYRDRKRSYPHEKRSNRLIAAIKQSGDTWVVDSFSNHVPKGNPQGLDYFLVSPDLKKWENIVDEWVVACNDELSSNYSVCTSQLSRKDVRTYAIAGVLSLGMTLAREAPTKYDADKVYAAINSIDPAQATEKLNALYKAQKEEALQKKLEEEKQHKINLERAKIEIEKNNKKTAALVAARKKLPVGAKDNCAVQVKYHSLIVMVSNTQYECSRVGTFNIEQMKEEGWITINKIPREINGGDIVQDLVIEKVAN